jgi:hypothetical protein
MKKDLFFLVLGLVIVTVASAPERAGPHQNRPSRFAPYPPMPTNPTSHANVSAGASGGSGNPWQPPQRQPASQRAGPVGQRPNCNDFQPSVRPINTGLGGSCSNNNSSRRVTSAPLQQPPVGPNVPSRRVFFPDPRPPRPNAFARDQAREQQNLEACRAVAVNTW